MARTNIPITEISALDAAKVKTAPTALDAANGMYLSAKGDMQNLLIEIASAGSTSGSISGSILGGTNPPAFLSDDLAFVVNPGTTQWFQIESARFAQDDSAGGSGSAGDIWIDILSGSASGSAGAVRLI